MRTSQRSRSSAFGFATTSAPNVSPSTSTGSAMARYVRSSPGGTSSKVCVLSGGAASPACFGRQPAETGDVTGEEPDADVVEAGAGGHLEPRHDETRRRRPLVHALDRLLGEELAELAGLPPEVGLGLALGVVLEEADRDRRGDDPRDDDAEEEEGG